MTIRALTSSTATMALCLALAAPAPILAQESGRPFPCVAPTGAVADNPNMLSAELMSLITAPASGIQAAPDDVQTCSAAAIRRGIERGGDQLQAAYDGAPQAVQDEIMALATADGRAMDEVPEGQAAAPVSPETPDTPANQAKSQQAQTPDVPDAPAAPAAEPAGQAAAPTAPDDQPNDQPTAEAPETSPAPQANPSPQQQAADTVPADAPVGEAGQQRMTEEQRQRLAEVRAERRAAIAATREDARAEAAEAQTRTVTEGDVRRADQDFDTAVNDTAPTATEDDDGLSTFEKALLLGLGAAVVGTVLNNGDEVVSNTGDRVVVERDGELKVLKNDDELLAQPGAQVSSQTYQDGSTRETISYEDGSQIITVRAADGTVLRRSMIRASDGEEVVLFDDTQQADPIDFDSLPEATAARQDGPSLSDQQALEAALQQAMARDVNRKFSLQQVRDYKQVRGLAPEVELDAVTFATGSAAIQPSQAEALSELGLSMREIIEKEPDTVFLIEGHTDAVGSAVYNLALSDRRAETVALALTQYFAVPPQNLITQGYGETDLKVAVLTDERANRRAAVRNITGLLY
ncbi:OmpA family protein [Marinibacterium sp. SX1]|uniref:OmpA family protein n=1 Tax=Marinibacterium sp. SX1 TaxID=3388424 RepID=UPI003D17B0CF